MLINGSAPQNLANLLISHLTIEDKRTLIESLKKSGYRSKRDVDEQEHQDLIEEYCYTTPPDEILRDNWAYNKILRLSVFWVDKLRI